MHTGMLWFDNSKDNLVVKVRKALDYYEKKYGRVPNLVLVNPRTMEGQEIPEGLPVRPYRPVLPGHIWVGIEDVQKVEEKQEAEEE